MRKVIAYIFMVCFLSLPLTAQEAVGLDVENLEQECLLPGDLKVDIKTIPVDEYYCYLDIAVFSENARRMSATVSDWDDNITSSYPYVYMDEMSLRFDIAHGNRAKLEVRALNDCGGATKISTNFFVVDGGDVNLNSLPGNMTFDLEPVSYDEDSYVVKVNASSLGATWFVVSVLDDFLLTGKQKLFSTKDSISEVFSESISYGSEARIEVVAENSFGSRTKRTNVFVINKEDLEGTASLPSVNGVVKYAVYSLSTGSLIAEVSSETEASEIMKDRGFCALMLKDEAGNILSVKKMLVK